MSKHIECKKYTLYKMSSRGFKLETHSLEHVFVVLSCFVCRSCMKVETKYIEEDGTEYIEGIPDNFDKLPIREQVDILLGTACGAEFIMEEGVDED